MPLARIVTRSYDEAHGLAERLRQSGYTVEIFGPDQLRLSEADLEIEVEVVPRDKALKVAAGRARKHEADIFVDRGVYSEPAAPAAAPEVIQEAAVEPEAAVPAPVMASAPLEAAPEISRSSGDSEAPEAAQEHISEVLENTLAEVGGAVADARQGITESWQHTRERAGSAVSHLAGKFAEVRTRRAAEREEQRRIREQEEELRRRERETEKARRAVVEEQARRAAEEERRLREQEWALRRLREEEERQQLIAEQRRLAAERAAAAEEERRRVVAEQQRLAAERAAEEAERKASQPALAEPAAPVVHDVDPVAAEMEARTRPPVEPPPRPRPAPRARPRVVGSGRQRQWQRAALYASIGALVIMIGFALAMRQEAPLSGSSNMLPEGAVQEQVPFGPASAAPHQVTPSPNRVATPPQRTRPRSTPAPSRRVRSRDSGVAEDEVIVHHYGPRHPAATKTSTTAGVRHYSDMDDQR